LRYFITFISRKKKQQLAEAIRTLTTQLDHSQSELHSSDKVSNDNSIEYQKLQHKNDLLETELERYHELFQLSVEDCFEQHQLSLRRFMQFRHF